MKFTIIFVSLVTYSLFKSSFLPNINSLNKINLIFETTKSDSKQEQNKYFEFSRKQSFDRLKQKINNKIPLVVHIRIPLCDNENQGIVSVPKKLGDGFDLNNNLYWGAKYGFKTHFKNHTDWKQISSIKNYNKEILERLILKKRVANGATIYLVADAYKGDAMQTCVKDFMLSTSGNKSEQIELEDEIIEISSGADLLIFNGHNGLMDFGMDFIPSKDQKIREVAVIGCLSHNYFKEHLLASRGYPLLMTTNLMAPEAYVSQALIESWLILDPEKEIRKKVGLAYHKYQKCGVNGATRLFRYGLYLN